MYEINFLRSPLTRLDAKQAIRCAHTRLGMDLEENVVEAHAHMLEQSGELDIVHCGNTARIKLARD